MNGSFRSAKRFQSTPPVRGATEVVHQPLAPGFISIHAPRAGGDLSSVLTVASDTVFQSTPPVRGATVGRMMGTGNSKDFNPRPPCGGRRADDAQIHSVELFQSTPPVRGATAWGEKAFVLQLISIHAPRAGGDLEIIERIQTHYEFQSTPPVRGATQARLSLPYEMENFNPRPPCGGRLRQLLYPPDAYSISIHAPRAGGDRGNLTPYT